MNSQNMISDYICPSGHPHAGPIIDEKDGFSALDCTNCGFTHAVPIPTSEELADFYASKFYESDRKADYFEVQAAQQAFWNSLFTDRLALFEKTLGKKGRILDMGCGPGFFLKFAKEHGWETLGVEPSGKAASFAKEELGVEVLNTGFEALSVDELGQFDVVYSHGVIEHVQSPLGFIAITKDLLMSGGLTFINCANDFNPFQKILRETKGFEPWWFVPPEHLNYFTVQSLSGFLEKQGFEVVDRITSFPIDMFLLMGENYVESPELGKVCHARRTAFEAALDGAGMKELRQQLYKAFAELDLGRQIDLLARKCT